MPRILERLMSIWRERRQSQLPVSVDRRHRRKSLREVDKELAERISDLEKTISMRRDDIFKRVVANDIQQVVIFQTFADTCTFKLRQGEFRMCKHPDHEAANTGVAKCHEELCPLILAAVKVMA